MPASAVDSSVADVVATGVTLGEGDGVMVMAHAEGTRNTKTVMMRISDLFIG
jgi:hypothetical protein